MAKHALDVEPDGGVSGKDTDAVESSDATASGFDPANVRFVTRNVSDTERAAVTAVLGTVLEQESAMLGHAPGTATSEWQRNQRGLRGAHQNARQRWNDNSQ